MRKPASAPKAIPAIMMMPVIGLNPGRKANAARDTAARADITATVTSSRVWGRRDSNEKKNGSMVSTTTSVLVR